MLSFYILLIQYQFYENEKNLSIIQMKYYPNYIIKRLTKSQYDVLKNIYINGEILVFPYSGNKNYYYYRIDT